PGTIEFIRRDAPADLVSLTVVLRLPPDYGIASVRLAGHLYAAGFSRNFSVSSSKNPQIGNGQIRRGHVYVLISDIPDRLGPGKFHIVVRDIFKTPASVHQDLPLFPVERTFNHIPVIQSFDPPVHSRFMIVVIYLDCMDGTGLEQINLYPLLVVVLR